MNSYRRLLVSYPLTFFFIIAYTGSWLVMLPYLRFGDSVGILPFSWPVPFGLSAAIAPFAGPFLAAFTMTGLCDGRKGIQCLLKRIIQWHVSLGWYIFALIGIPVITVLGAIVLPEALSSFQMPWQSFLTYPLSFLITLVIGGPLGEEPGWRGFALPRLQRVQGPLLGSLVLGILWAFWHLPYFWMPEWGTPKEGLLDIVYFVLASLALTFIYTWVFNNTKNSLLIVILIHTTNDAFFINHLFVSNLVTNTLLPFVIGFGAFALLLVLFTRGNLGYKQDKEKN